MNTSFSKPIGDTIKGTARFLYDVGRDHRTLFGMPQALIRTRRNRVSHAVMNNDQYPLIQNGYAPKIIAILAPGLQLDGASMMGLRTALITQGVPTFIPGSLPYGKEAIKFREHPRELVDRIVRFTRQAQSEYPDTHMLLMAHSYAGPQALHAADRLIQETPTSHTGKVIAVPMMGTLGHIGISTQAIHRLWYREPSRVLSGQDIFIDEAREMQERNPNITVVDRHDGWLSLQTQAGVLDLNNPPPHLIISGGESLGHYRQLLNPNFSHFLVKNVLERVETLLKPTQP